MAVPAGAVDGQDVPGIHLVDGGRVGVQVDGPGRGGATVGHSEEQAQDELREVESRAEVLLRQEHHSQDGGEAVRVSVRVRSAEFVGVSFWLFFVREKRRIYFYGWNLMDFVISFLLQIFSGRVASNGGVEGGEEGRLKRRGSDQIKVGKGACFSVPIYERRRR